MITKFLLAALAALFAVSASPFPQADLLDASAIVGGTTAKANDFLFIVAMVHNNTVTCGGSLLDSTTVLVAAHCLEGLSAKDVSIIAGTHNINSGGFGSGVTKMIPYPDFSSKLLDNDVGIIKLETLIPNTFNITFPTLAAAGSDPMVGTVGKIAGWGDTQTLKGFPEEHCEVNFPIIDRAKCAALYKKNKLTPPVTKNMFCAAYKSGGKDVCSGDSGGPMIDASTGSLIGVVSWGWKCARADSPGVYASVAVFEGFYRQALVNLKELCSVSILIR